MKYGKFALIVLFLGLSTAGMSTSYKDASAGSVKVTAKPTVFAAQSLLEKFLNIRGVTVSSKIPFDVISSTLEQNCPAESIATAKNQLESAKGTWNNILVSDKTPLRIRIRFSTIKRMITTTYSRNEEVFCFKKYYMYGILNHVQEYYANNTNITQLGSAPEESIMGYGNQNLITEKNISINHNKDELNIQERVFAELGDTYIRQTLSELTAKGVLNQSDLDRIHGKLYINYINKCGTMHGSYTMTQRVGGTDRQLQKIQMNVNLCYDETYVYNYQKYIDQLLTHELAHYLYYFKDTAPERLTAICRTDEINKCNNSDFFSTYSRKNKEEDYAESFAYRFMQQKYGIKNTSPMISLKNRLNHFDELFSLR